MDHKRLVYLIDICKTSGASTEEREELEQWYNSFDVEPDILNNIDQEESRKLQNDIWQKLSRKKRLAHRKTNRVSFSWKTIIKAAILILVSGVGLYFYSQQDPTQESLIVADNKNIIPPGQDRAILTLDNGVRIDLNTLAVGEEIREDGFSVLKENDGSISYSVDPAFLTSNTATFNTVSTPRGGQYKVALPDGSLVWLNAESSIRYPAVFDDSERIVYLTGEAYFEIKQQVLPKIGKRIPFIVATKQQEIEVLGTHFNVKAYEDERETLTTLLEGKVRVVGIGKGNLRKERILKVGEQASWNNADFNIQQADTNKAVAWKNGKFIFSGENVKDIMKGISRWYDVEVSYKGDLSRINFTGSLSRYENINEILKKLELTGTVRFEILNKETPGGTERRVVVMP